ncbi:MAG: LCP family protein [Anaerolineaceae bacterium]
MKDTQPINIAGVNLQPPVKKKRANGWRIFLYILLGLAFLIASLYLIWVRPALREPLSEPLSLPTMVVGPAEGEETAVVVPPSNLEKMPVFVEPTLESDKKPVCGDEAAWNVLLIGIDYSDPQYTYGLADVIRVLRVDFVDMKVNMVALPRDLLVEAPEGRFTEQNPMKINQAYLFGTPGWGGYLGEGIGANSLAEVIRYNFGVTTEHYAVINFDTVIEFIDAIGGVEVNLPQGVSDPNPELGSFPAGPQILSGERALALMRIRTNYSDSFRVGNQTLVMQGILNKLMQPASLVKVPSLLNQFSEAFLTDLSIDQIASIGVCFLRNFELDNLHAAQIPDDLLTVDYAFIPSLDSTSYTYRWDQRTVDWIHQNLQSQ